MNIVIARELEILGSHGMPAHAYPSMLEMILTGKLAPRKLIRKTVTLEESIDELMAMGRFAQIGVSVIDTF